MVQSHTVELTQQAHGRAPACQIGLVLICTRHSLSAPCRIKTLMSCRFISAWKQRIKDAWTHASMHEEDPTNGGAEGADAEELAGELGSKLGIALVQGRAHLHRDIGTLLSGWTSSRRLT